MNLLKKLIDMSNVKPTNTNIPFVFTYQQCVNRVNQHGRICSHSFSTDGKNYVSFNDNHIFGYDEESDKNVFDAVPVSTRFPKQVIGRKGLEDGVVCTFDHELFIFYQNMHVIYTLDELLDIKGFKPNGEPK